MGDDGEDWLAGVDRWELGGEKTGAQGPGASGRENSSGHWKCK